MVERSKQQTEGNNQAAKDLDVEIKKHIREEKKLDRLRRLE